MPGLRARRERHRDGNTHPHPHPSPSPNRNRSPTPTPNPTPTPTPSPSPTASPNQAGEDGCVFFVALDAASSSYEPIGFMAHPAASPVSCMCWAADASVLYVGYRNGDLYELKPPSLAKVEPSEPNPNPNPHPHPHPNRNPNPNLDPDPNPDPDPDPNPDPDPDPDPNPNPNQVDTSVTFELPFAGELVDTSACRPPKPKVDG